jgi:GNAT superfamily N-acetyltransferase
MPIVHDLTTIRTLLDRDRAWSAYAIGDLDPANVDKCEWHIAAEGSSALLLLYRGFEPPIVFAMGDAAALAPLFPELDAAEISLQVPPGAVDAMAGSYTPTFTRDMLRMSLRPDQFAAEPHDDVQPIAEPDLAAVSTLYQDGHRRGEGPVFFSAAMLQQRSFHGVWEGDELIAIAGTHLYSAALGVCTIGNVYTRSDRRGRGLAARTTSAVIEQALRDRIPTIVLNVGRGNAAARRVYERLGFHVHCDFVEGEARRAMTSQGRLP